MNPTEKNLLIGAFATGAVDLGLEGYGMYLRGSGTSLDDLRKMFPYQEIHPAIPPLDDWLACGGVPLLLYGLGKGMKRRSLVEMAKGGAIYGVSELIGQTMFRVIRETQPVLRYRVVR